MIKTKINLLHLKEGQTGRIISIIGGWHAVKRLSDLGLTPNTLIKVLKKAPFFGPIEIECRGSKLVIGRGLALKIFVIMENE